MPTRDVIPVHRACTLRLRVPREDWAPVIAGTKTQFRGVGRGCPNFDKVQLPRPIVLYSHQPFREEAETRLAVLEQVWKEPLAAITPEGLAAEGMSDVKEFRRYWIDRHKRSGFKPLAMVTVYSIELWREGDRERFGDNFMQFFYGPWL